MMEYIIDTVEVKTQSVRLEKEQLNEVKLLEEISTMQGHTPPNLLLIYMEKIILLLERMIEELNKSF
jgi:hypothetical protein